MIEGIAPALRGGAMSDLQRASIFVLALACAQQAHAQTGVPKEPASGPRAAPAPPAAAPSPDSREGPGAVLLVRTRGDERVVLRIRAELDAIGWQLVEVGPDAELDAAPLESLATARSAAAVIRMNASRAQVELWMAKAPGAESGTHEWIAAADAPANDRVLALRVVETLRARSLAFAPQPSPGTPAPAQPSSNPANPARRPAPQSGSAGEGRTAPAEAADPEGGAAEAVRAEQQPARAERADSPPAERDEEEEESEAEVEPEDTEPSPPLPPLRVPQLWLELAPALTLSPGEIGPAVAGWASVRLQLAREWSLAALVLVPVWSERIREPEGSARISTWLLGGAADYLLNPRPWELSAGLGLAALVSLMSGSADPPFRGEDEVVTTFGPLARASLHLEVGGGLRLCARAAVGVSLPALEVQFDERATADWGQPFVLATLGVELPLLGE